MVETIYVDLAIELISDNGSGDDVLVSLTPQKTTTAADRVSFVLSPEQQAKLKALIAEKADIPITFNLSKVPDDRGPSDVAIFSFWACGTSAMCPCKKWIIEPDACKGYLRLSFLSLVHRTHLIAAHIPLSILDPL